LKESIPIQEPNIYRYSNRCRVAEATEQRHRMTNNVRDAAETFPIGDRLHPPPEGVLNVVELRLEVRDVIFLYFIHAH
jgi:hypothetical protein